MKTIVLFGPNGQVGWELQRVLCSLGQVITVSSKQVDISDAAAIRQMIQQTQAHIIVNAAAYTAVDKAEVEPHIAMAVNAMAAEVMAQEAKRIGALLVHYSTDYVYPGDANSPYAENAQTGPLCQYGRSKLAGDEAIQAVDGDYLILRTSWVYGTRGQNFLRTMQRLMQDKDALSIVSDQLGSPTWSRTIAEVTGQILAQQPAVESGVYHLSAEGQTNWYAFAQEIRDLSGLTCALTPISTEQYPTPAARPAYSVLAGDKLASTFGLVCPDWRQALALCLAYERE